MDFRTKRTPENIKATQTVLGGKVRKVRSPLTIFGGKSLITDVLLPMIPPHKCYCEVFGGAGHLLFAKPQSMSKLEVYNDLDGNLVDFFRAMQNSRERILLQGRWVKTPYSRELYNTFLKTWRHQECRLERIYQWFIVVPEDFFRSVRRGVDVRR